MISFVPCNLEEKREVGSMPKFRAASSAIIDAKQKLFLLHVPVKNSEVMTHDNFYS